MDNAGLQDRPSKPANAQSGFTLVEILVALAMIVLLALSANTLTRLSFTQLRYFSQPQNQRLEAMYEMWRWMENDILQMRGDLPWKMERSLDEQRCVTGWTFVTENLPAIGLARPFTTQVRYRVEGRTLVRQGLLGGQVLTEKKLLDNVKCLHPRYRQDQRWTDTPRSGRAIQAISLTLHWQGPTVERLWPVELPYDDD
ncbi:MAG: prepilin-type N-terminal cleavage/methylation domain-containing protein [Kluyvera sp.]|uniref:prepilin-type N-terminal cleavage/methylation domain-containing protein n=1 Tax=Kluyvera sp. TaxID=1538228 RepID=UPI003F3FE45B